MKNMNKEVHYEGWLIKSPPSKRIWRSRWRRRWFTLKQGEIPEQFCLEYYTDRNCRKLKGIIDLDQCEQVDCGLRLENRKQKFQYMFDIKTPKRTYYLAADSAEDMRDWVNCICQVCHLHDTNHSLEYPGKWRSSNNKNTPTRSASNSALSDINKEIKKEELFVTMPPASCNKAYENSDSTYVNSEHKSCMELNNLRSNLHNSDTSSINAKSSDNSVKIYLNASELSKLKERNADRFQTSGAIRKIPENLKIQDSPLFESIPHSVQPSPALSTSSGPYIPISECFSGIPKHLENPITPLNNLDPKFYDTPRSHNNIGLNLTSDQSYSPKITNCNTQQITASKDGAPVLNRSDSDSESVFTDDDEWTYPMPLRENVDRSTRPSDSSVENESFVLTYSQRFSKMPDDVTEKVYDMKYNVDTENKNQLDRMSIYKNKRNLSLDIKNNERTLREVLQLSDTENTSPAIGPQDASSLVDESYDIPRSHQLPYHNIDQMFKEKIWSPENASSTKISKSMDAIADPKTDAQKSVQKHFYTNAAPNKLEGNVFRYDFVDPTNLPPVNRKLKPKINKTVDGSSANQCTLDRAKRNTLHEDSLALTPPSVDRNLKPNVYKLVNPISVEQELKRPVDVLSSIGAASEREEYMIETSLPDNNKMHLTSDISALHQRSASITSTLHQPSVKVNPLPTNMRDEPQLQYFDLDVANPPTVNRQSIGCNLTKQDSNKPDLLSKGPPTSGVVYNSVDFLKTEAFKRIREERKKESEGVGSK
ncbi:unnamed protein product [Ceratitis capitata]|nr:unnamed protein product [Ceratitis capitata]